MDLHFLGRGGAFFPQEGNTSAFFIEGKKLCLIDCGELVFKKIVETHLLEFAHIEEVYVLITHTHGDHAGSLGSLVYYCNYGFYPDLQIKINIVAARPIWLKILENLDSAMIDSELYTLVDAFGINGKFKAFSEVSFIPTLHQANEPAFCIEFETSRGKVFYSGDTRDLAFIAGYVRQDTRIDKMFVEATTLDYDGNVHLPLNGLDRVIPRSIREKVYLMHFNNYECIDMAKALGFQVVEAIR